MRSRRHLANDHGKRTLPSLPTTTVQLQRRASWLHEPRSLRRKPHWSGLRRCTGRLVDYIFLSRNRGFFEPEMRLYILHLPVLGMASGLVMFGATAARVCCNYIRAAAFDSVGSPWMKRNGLQNMFIACGFISLGINSLIIPLVFWGNHSRQRLAERYHQLLEQEGHSTDC